MKNQIIRWAIATAANLLFIASVWGQHTLTATLPKHAGQQLKLVGYSGMHTYTLDSSAANDKGEFSLSYDEMYFGMAHLLSENNKSFVVMLSGEGIELQGESLGHPESIVIKKGEENKLFEQYVREQPRREQSLDGWKYLQKIYAEDSLFAQHSVPVMNIAAEIARIRAEDSLYLANLPEESYVKWYLPYKSLTSNVRNLAVYRPDEIPAAIAQFRSIDFSDFRWQSSGLLKNAIEAQVWLIENSAGSLDSVFAEINTSTEIIINKLKDKPEVLNTVGGHLFSYLEERSLFESAGYLALKMLNDDACELEVKVSSKLEAYRKMKPGNTAPDIVFGPNTYYPEDKKAGKLSELNTAYTVLVFAAGWCPHCTDLISKMKAKYPAWRQQGVEVVLVSLDETQQDFVQFAAPLPFISTTDYKKWDSRAVQDFFVYATPTMYLLDKDLKIVLKPRSAEQMDAWVEWYLVKGNQ